MKEKVPPHNICAEEYRTTDEAAIGRLTCARSHGRFGWTSQSLPVNSERSSLLEDPEFVRMGSDIKKGQR